MLAMNTYPREYIDACRFRVASQVAAFRKLANSKGRGGVKGTIAEDRLAQFEGPVFNNMLIVLDRCFVHRSRTIEASDGNPLNEVRVMVDSMIRNGETMMADSTIKLNPAKTVLKYRVGDFIRLNMREFLLLAEAFFAEIERRYAEP